MLTYSRACFQKHWYGWGLFGYVQLRATAFIDMVLTTAIRCNHWKLPARAAVVVVAVVVGRSGGDQGEEGGG